MARDGWHGLNISVSERPAAGIVCPSLPSFDERGVLIRDEDCFFVDDDGLIFQRVPGDDHGVYNRYYTPALPDDASIIGLLATSTSKFKALQTLFNTTKSAGIVSRAMLIKDSGEYELYADNPVGGETGTSSHKGPVVIYLSDRVPLEIEIDNLVQFWKKMVEKARVARARLEWSEIKLQYPPNVFWVDTK